MDVDLDQTTSLCQHAETEGFDMLAGQTWIYPTNYPVREYQFNIVRNALYKNTLVSLPTGLGKTFIAAVVMFNFYRWYPTGKIVFMAPTRPLVKQQMDACYDIMGIPKESTIELIGTNMSTSRENLWNEKRVFFITPQILQNDLDKIATLSSKIKCLVFDEAHKARGNHAYCEVIRKMCKFNKYFRVLALSATPGSHVEDVLEVVQNLMISHLEFRTEESLDVSKYVFKRNLTTVVVPLDDKLQEVVNEYLKLLEVNTRTLMKYKVFQGSCGSLTKGKIFMTMKQYQQNRGSGSANYGEIMKCFTVCMTLYHAWELLVRHGLRSFTTFFDEHIDKPTLRNNVRLIQLIQDVKEYLGPPPIVEELPNGECVQMSKDVKFGHPKFYKLRDILMTHFEESSSSRVIVFFEYRESVMEAYALLRQSHPTIRPKIFIGQKSGITQRIQTSVVKAFREGQCNTLLSTSIGEEGLDVGEVDLIICFDISNKSPIRMVQRMGRTGRKKEGSIIVLVTEGKEQQTLKDCLIHKNNVTSHVMGSRELAKGLSSTSPRLIPAELTPKCEKIFITVNKEPVTKKNNTLKEMFRKVSSGSSEPVYSPNLQIIEIEERLPSPKFLLDDGETTGPVNSVFCKQIQKQRSFQDTHIVKHSKETELLVNLLQLADSKKFNIPMSQIGTSQCSQKNLKQTDIRNMFFKNDSCADFVLPSTQVLQKPTSPLHEEKSSFGSRELFNELLNFLTIQSLEYDQQCKLCPTGNCIELYTNPIKTDSVDALNWVELDDSVFTSITLNDLKTYEKNMDKSGAEFSFDETMNFVLDQTPQLKTEDEILEANDIDKSILGELVDKSFGFQAPKTLDSLLNKFSTTIVDVEPSQKISVSLQEDTRESILSFFKIEKLNDIFTDCVHSAGRSSQETLIYSPNIFDNSVPPLNIAANETTPKKRIVSSDDSGSPILCSFSRNVTLRKKDQTQRKLVFGQEKQVGKGIASCSTPFEENCDRQMNCADDIELSSLCDLSYLGFKSSSKIIDSRKTTAVTSTQVENKLNENESKLSTLDKYADVLDDSDFKWLKTSVKEKKNSLESAFDAKIDNDPMNIDADISNTANFNVTRCTNELVEEFNPLASVDKSNDTEIVNHELNKHYTKEKKSQIKTNPVIDDEELDWFRSTATPVKNNASKPSDADKVRETDFESLNPSAKKKQTVSKVESAFRENVNSKSNLELEKKQGSKQYTKEKANLSTESVIVIDDDEDINWLMPTAELVKKAATETIITNKLNNSNYERFKTSTTTKNTKIDMQNGFSKRVDTDVVINNDFEWAKPKTVEKSNDKEITGNTTLDILDVSDIFDTSDFDLSKNRRSKNTSKIDTSQATVTQLISLINKPDGVQNFDDSSQKENQNEHTSHKDAQSTSHINITQVLSLINTNTPNKERFSISSGKVSTQKNIVVKNVSPHNVKHNAGSLDNAIDDVDDLDDFEVKPAKIAHKLRQTRLSRELENVPSAHDTRISPKINHSDRRTSPDIHLSDSEQLEPNLDESIRNLSHNMLAQLVDSDEEFENKPRDTGWMRAKPSNEKRKAISPKMNSGRKRRKDPLKAPVRKKMKRKNEFIDDEAELSEDSTFAVSDDERDGFSQDCYEGSFVAHESICNDTQMQARYLQSVRSPVNRGRFKIPERPVAFREDVFSQPVPQDNDTYLDDSFVVEGDEVEEIEELSQLEILEQQLEVQRKARKKLKSDARPTNRRRIINLSDSE